MTVASPIPCFYTYVMIQNIEQTIMSHGRENETLWFHPRACLIPNSSGRNSVFMTMQRISGSDYFHPVHWTASEDSGRTWSKAEPIPGFGRNDAGGGIEEGVCDVVPEYHEKSGTILAMGHNVFYRGDAFFRPQPRRFTVYAVRDIASGKWSGIRKLEWPGSGADQIYTAGCAQRYTFSNGEILIPLSVGERNREDRRVLSAIAEFDGDELKVRETGPLLELAVKRGLLEPSITRYKDGFYMTIRAEDDRGYVVSSDDGLSWSPITPWRWDDGEELTMSTTQQRWMTHSERLYLVYTRKDSANINVMRWRAPLYIAEVDTDTMCLKRESERIAVSLTGDGINDPDHVARLGNFHTVNISPRESWVTVGESLPNDGYSGDTILGRIHWTDENRLVTSRG
ncbi:MAG: exo-alpha-sialidase [Spirochaetales bacterium]|jgi:hypothetical protein|nr:exo-alpha-sialidase [Spirochaetales bacterium]